MERIGKINDRDVFYISTKDNSNWLDFLPTEKWVVFTVTATNNQTANTNYFNPVTYAIKVDDIATFSSKIDTYLQAIKASNLDKYANFSIKKLIIEADKGLQNNYHKSSDLELTFLEQFKDFGISLYKANSTLDNWSKLQTDPIFFHDTVFDTPCN